MNLKQRKLVMYAVMALALLSALTAHFSSGQIQKVFIGATVILIVGTVILWGALWRCPNCHKFMAGLNARRCPHCGRNLDR